MLAALLVLLPIKQQFVPLGTNYHLDYELEEVSTRYKGGKESTLTATLRHDLGIQTGQERYTYTYKSEATKDKEKSLLLVGDKAAKTFEIYVRLEGNVIDKNKNLGLDAYEDKIASIKHLWLDDGEEVKGEETFKTVAGVPCHRVETSAVSFGDGGIVKCVYWFPDDELKRKRVGWLEVEKFVSPVINKAYVLVLSYRTTKIRFGAVTPKEIG